MSDEYSIMTSAAEYVTGIEAGALSTVPNIKLAKRMAEDQARQVLRTIKAHYDNGAEMFRNPS